MAGSVGNSFLNSTTSYLALRIPVIYVESGEGEPDQNHNSDLLEDDWIIGARSAIR